MKAARESAMSKDHEKGVCMACFRNGEKVCVAGMESKKRRSQRSEETLAFTLRNTENH